MILASIRSFGRCPCASCLIEKEHVHRLGQAFSRRRAARRRGVEVSRTFVFESGYSLRSEPFERLLAAHSLVPTRVR